MVKDIRDLVMQLEGSNRAAACSQVLGRVAGLSVNDAPGQPGHFGLHMRAAQDAEAAALLEPACLGHPRYMQDSSKLQHIYCAQCHQRDADALARLDLRAAACTALPQQHPTPTALSMTLLV